MEIKDEVSLYNSICHNTIMLGKGISTPTFDRRTSDRPSNFSSDVQTVYMDGDTSWDTLSSVSWFNQWRISAISNIVVRNNEIYNNRNWILARFVLFSKRQNTQKNEHELECIKIVPTTRRNSMLRRFRVTNEMFTDEILSIIDSIS